MTCQSVSRNILIFFNCLFFIVGAILLAVGFYVLFTPYSFEIFAVLDNGIIQAGVYCIITIGIIIFLIAAFGLFGACCKSKPLLVLYMIIIFIILAVQIAVCAAVVQYRQGVTRFAADSLQLTMNEYEAENGTDSFSVGWNVMQIYFECCGSNDYIDWSTSTWGNDTEVFKHRNGAKYPVTCCTVTDPSVVFSGTVELDSFINVDKCYGVGETIPNQYMAGNGTGCFTSFEQYVIENIQLLGGFGIGLAAFEILLFILAMVVCLTIEQKEEVV